MHIQQGTDHKFIFGTDGRLLGLSFGADATTEHECGTKPLATSFGVTYEGDGVAARQIRNTGDLRLVGRGADLWFLANIEGQLPAEAVQYRNRNPDLACAWSDSAFAIRVKGEQNINLLYEIRDAFLRLDIAFVMTRHFLMTGFSVVIRSRFPEEEDRAWIAEDQKNRALKAAWDEEAKTLVPLLRAAGKRWFSLGHSTIRDDQGTLRVWLNPEDQGKNNSGWFTFDDLRAWARGEGRIIKKPKPKITFRHQGPSGRGEKRILYYVDANAKYVGGVEGVGRSWRIEDDLLSAGSHEARGLVQVYPTRDAAARELVSRAQP